MMTAKRLKHRKHKHRDRSGSGCMSGLVSIFDFRHGRITRRLLSDHHTTHDHMPQITIGPSYPASEVSSLMDSEEPIESSKHQVIKESMEDEMQTDHQITEKTSTKSFDNREINLDELMSKLILINEKGIEDQNSKSFERSNSLDHKRSDLTSEEPLTRKNRNIFRRRSKSQECISLTDNDAPLASNPNSNGFKVRHERSVSQFSFQEIKKKLKNAIAKSSRDSGCREKPQVDGNSAWSSPNRDHFFSERFFTTSNGFTHDAGSRFCRSERELNGNKEVGDMSDRVSSIYIEAKKHLYDLLNNEDECTEILTVESHSRTLGKLLCFPGYNASSSNSGHINEVTVNESQLNEPDDDHHEPEVSDEVHQTEGLAEILKPLSPEAIEILEVAISTKEHKLSCSPVVSSRSSHATDSKSEEIENTPDDKTGKPSPVSVLEPLFSDDDISPARTISRSAESSIRPLRIRFEETATWTKDQETCILNHPENEESVYEYIEAVLLASDLNWSEFEQRWLSSTSILDPSLYHELQIFSSRPIHDQRFLFDATNDILTEVCDCSLDFFSGRCKPYMNPVPKGMELINMVWERIESRINCRYPRSLDQLIKKDFERDGVWIDVHLETREMVMEIEESMVEDIIDDTVVSLLYG